MSKVLEQKLGRSCSDEASAAAEISELINQAIRETRLLSRGLHPVSLDENGLMTALQALAATTRDVFGIACEFRCDEPVLVREASTALHLYRIAQEAVTNAVRHGKTQAISVTLCADGRQATLEIENDGRPFPPRLPKDRGIGLQMMQYRAEMIGSVLNVRRGAHGGTRVTCVFEREIERDEGRREDAAKDDKAE
jgi:signal transduction histidine kinase